MAKITDADIMAQLDAQHAALCGNGLTSAVADWLVDLAARVRLLEMDRIINASVAAPDEGK